MLITFIPAVLIFTAVFLFTLTRPKIAIYLPIMFSSAYLIKVKIFGLPSTLLEIILIAVLLGVWTEFIKGGFRGRVGAIHELPLQRSLLWGIALFFMTATISTLIAPHPHVAWGQWKAMVVAPIFYALTLLFLIEKEKKAENVVKALLMGGLVSISLSVVSMGFGVDFGRFRGIYDVPNSLALIVAPLLTICIIGRFLGWEPAPPTRWSRALTLIFGIVLVATQSLAGLVAVAVTVIGVVIFLKKGWKMLIVLGLIIVLGLGLQTGTGKISHLFNRQSSSLIAREQIWYTASRMIKQHPILGTGLGTFEPNYQNELRQILNRENQQMFFACTLYPVPCVIEWVVRDPHNIILSFWLNTGLVGLVAIVFLIARMLRKMVTALQNERRNVLNTNYSHQIILGAGFLTLLFFGLFDVPYWKNDLALLWWVLLI